MKLYLQAYRGIPVALRHEGETSIKCPYCGNLHHYHPSEVGHIEALCEDRNISITINGREFIPNYGVTIYEYKLEDGVLSLSDFPSGPPLELRN